ncbi:MAG: hypothetical protein D6719_10795 [Candidatus Dadabacteria bacterium]|nr:MAG: hypothetical protein D6719_10795 [Candidatus Dadabacteria bacterium]
MYLFISAGEGSVHPAGGGEKLLHGRNSVSRYGSLLAKLMPLVAPASTMPLTASIRPIPIKNTISTIRTSMTIENSTTETPWAFGQFICSILLLFLKNKLPVDIKCKSLNLIYSYSSLA